MDSSTIFPNQDPLSIKNPFYLEFRQLKEYYNFRRQFKLDKKNEFLQAKIIQNQYYLINKIWLEEWKKLVGYDFFSQNKEKREATDKDYSNFKNYMLCQKDLKVLSPLDNSNIYKSNGDINPLAEFVIINKECQKVFGESRQKLEYNIFEKSCPLKFLPDKIILYINENTRLICFRNDFTGDDEQVIIIFMGQQNKDIISNQIEKENFKGWLKDRQFEMNSPVEKEMDEQGCKIKIINKNLKLKEMKYTNKVAINSNITKYQLSEDLKNQINSQVIEIFSETQVALKSNNKSSVVKNKIHKNQDNNNNFQSQNNNNNFQCQNNNNIFQNQNNNNYPMISNPNQIPNNMQFNNNQINNNFYNNNINNNTPNGMMMNNPNSCNNMMLMQNMNMQRMGMNNMQNMNMNMQCMSMQNMNICMSMNNMNMQNMNNNIMNMNNNVNFMNSNNNNNINMQMPGMEIKNFKTSTNSPPGNQKHNNPGALTNPFTAGITYPHQAGLANVGQSCYMNATIECLSNIQSLSNNLLQSYGTYDINSQPLCVSYSSLIYKLFHTNEKYIEPRLFKDIIGKLNPLFEGNHAADAKDLIFFIIETLHKELLPQSKNNNENNEIDFLQQEQNARNEKKMFDEFIKEYELNKTIVSGIFYGINRSVMKCESCGIQKYSFQTFNLLIFPLKKVKDYKIKKYGYSSNLDLNLYDAFYCEQEDEKLDGENMIYCNYCRKLSPGNHKQQIFGMPNILIIILNRGKNNADFNEEFRFEETLDFTNKNLIVNENSTKKFFLCGIITHLGESGSGGHFIAYCRKSFNDNFLCYNDSAVTPVGVLDAMSAKISQRDIEKKTPYILLYHYMNK